MMTAIRRKRLRIILGLLLVSGLVLALILYALSQNINLFYTPSQIIKGEVPLEKRIRLGGIVQKESVVRGKDLEISFILSDLKQTIRVDYKGLLPDLFREGQGVVASGSLKPNGVFIADEILAKHDENYMPPEVADAISGQNRE